MKNTKKESGNSRGMSLIEVVVALSVMSIVSLGIGTTVVQMTNSQKKIENKVELNDTLSSFAKYVSTKDFCADSLLGRRIGGGINLQVANFKGVGGGGGVIRGGSNISENVRVDVLRAEFNTEVAPVNTMFEGAAARERMIDVVIQTSKFDPGADGKNWMPSPERRFLVPVKVIGGVVRSCNHLTDEESSCTAVGGVWNSTTRTCTPDSMCENKGTYIGWTCQADRSVSQTYYNRFGGRCGQTIRALSPSGSTVRNTAPARTITGGITNPFNNRLSCPTGSTRFHTGTDRHTYSGLDCGKKCSFSYIQTANFYTCMKCN